MVLMRRFPGSADEDRAQAQHPSPHASGINFQVTASQVLLLTPKAEAAGRPPPLGARAHFTPLTRRCPNRRQRVTDRTLPENGSETPGNECGSLFPKGRHPRQPPHPEPSAARQPQAGGRPPPKHRPSLSPGTQTHTGSCTDSLVCMCCTHCPVGSSLKSPRFGRTSEVRPAVVSVQWSHPTIDNGPYLVWAFPVTEASAAHFLFQAFPAASPPPEQVSRLLHS